MAKKLETQDVNLMTDQDPDPAATFNKLWSVHQKALRTAQANQGRARDDLRKLEDQTGTRADVVALLKKLHKMEEDDAREFLEQTFQRADWLGMGVVRQLDLFKGEQKNAAPSEEISQARLLDDAYFAGWDAQRSQKDRTENNQTAGSELHRKWDQGWLDSLEAIGKEMEPKGKRKAAAGAEPKPNKDRRGGADAEAKPAAAVVPMTAARQRGGRRQEAEAPAAEAAPEDSAPQEDDRDPRDVDPMDAARAHANLINLGNTKH